MSQTPESWDVLLSVKELALALNRSRTFVEAMKRRGFVMPGGRATLFNAVRWLIENPHPRAGRVPQRSNTEHRKATP